MDRTSPPSLNAISEYHAKYYAHLLKRRSSSSDLGKLGQSLLNASVDLNPHQVEAALFAFRSPLSRGAILADEVGLGKTIEAGLIISQLWAERRRKILIIVPTTLRKQWAQELTDKFFIPSEILDSNVFNTMRKSGVQNPFTDAERAVICSYHFVRSQKEAIEGIPWDLVVIDEAHRLRNVYRTDNKIARAIKESVQGRPKVLLTATPLQNSLLELYGLVGFLDEHLFGDLSSFRAQYLRGNLDEAAFQDLRRRIKPICQRTLRRQVTEYVRFTNRIPITQDFTPTAEEQKLYDAVSEYLRRDNLHALPSSQRKLMTLVLRKLLASSTFAIAGTLRSLIERLQAQRMVETQSITPPPEQDFEAFNEMAEEWTEDASDVATSGPSDEARRRETEIVEEIEELTAYHNLATSITRNAKGHALLQALGLGFEKLASLGASRKAIIFTESRRTQEYLRDLLESNGFAGQTMTFNGTNTDARSTAIYEAWRARHVGEDVVTGSKVVDIRAALIEHFKDSASVLIATEAAAEGVNLQFCALVVNYDLPWNPQRIEQRIGRCHRYGQTHDVVVINFLNRKNEADLRVFQILFEKFRLFDGVFGASDEVLGALESGVDFERRIAEIYQSCRTPEEIDAAFNQLQRDLEEQIDARMTATRSTLLENFDEDVHTRLRVDMEQASAQLDRLSRYCWAITKHQLAGAAHFDDTALRFTLDKLPLGAPPVLLGEYQFITHSNPRDGAHVYRSGHPLAEFLVSRASNRALSPAQVEFNYTGYGRKITLIERLLGKSGYLSLTKLTISALEQEDRLLFVGMTSDGEPLDQETCEKLLEVCGCSGASIEIPANVSEKLGLELERAKTTVLTEISGRNTHFFEEEIEKLERWAEDLKEGLEAELKELDFEIKALKKNAKLEVELEPKLALHRKVKELEAERSRKRRSLYDAQDEIDRKKEALISHVEECLKQKLDSEHLFAIRWEVR
ncbi:MAG: DEAD/DEAH box helicase family protein [Acidobacteriia bacterium]|nr:DEAD/DEAH box helicase family protein [Terriglobia bacterium]